MSADRAARRAALLEELRALAALDKPAPADVEGVWARATAWVREAPADAPVVLKKGMALVLHADPHAARASAGGALKLLDVVATLPEEVIEEAMPVLAQLLDFSVGKWSFAQSTYRFARFPKLRQRILFAALDLTVSERDHKDAAVAVMQLSDLVGGLQRSNAFDEAGVADALARFATGQRSAGVRRAVVSWLLEAAPQIVERVFATNPDNPELFPWVEDLFAYAAEERGHLSGLTLQEERVRALGTMPLALLEHHLVAGEPPQRMAAALAAPHAAALDEAGTRLREHVRALLDDEAVHHAQIEGQVESFNVRAIAVAPLTALLARAPDAERATLALDALRAAAPHNVAAVLLPLARLCEPGAATAALHALATDTARTRAVRFVALDVACGLARDAPAARDGAREACVALAETLASEGVEAALVEGALMSVAELAQRHRPEEIEALVRVWPALLARADIAPAYRMHSYRNMREQCVRHAWLVPFVDDARGTLLATAATDKRLAEMLLYAPL